MFTIAQRNAATTNGLMRAHVAAPAAPLISSLPQSHTITLNWEDVVAPTSLLAQRIGLRASREAMENVRNLLAQDTYLQQALAAIDEQAVTLLSTAAAIGPVVLVTENSLKFMEVTCNLFFPRLAGFLLQSNMPGAFASHNHQPQHRVRVVAPPRKFASAMEHATWRVSIFQNVCSEQAQRTPGCAFSVISVSALDREAQACLAAVQKTVDMAATPKCVRVADPTTLSLEGFYAQLQTLQGYVTTVAAHATAFATHI